MKKIISYLLLLAVLVLLGACSLIQEAGDWKTLSKSPDPYYELQVKGKSYRILFEENASTRMDWYLNDYQPGTELKMRTLNVEHLKDTVGGSAEQELSGQGFASFTMVYETRYKPQIERSYYKVQIKLDDQGNVDASKSSMTFEKMEREEFKTSKTAE